MFERKLLFRAGYDLRNGKHPPHLLFVVKGSEGALVWDLNTGWYLDGEIHAPESWGLWVHEPFNDPHLEDYEMTEHCDFIDGACQSFKLEDAHWVEDFKTIGPDGIFKRLESIYEGRYSNSPKGTPHD